MKRHKYTKEFLEIISVDCKSFADVARKLGLNRFRKWFCEPPRGAKKFNINFKHFGRKSRNKESYANIRKKPEEIFRIVENGGNREKAYLLRRALIESEVEEKCSVCKQDTIWNNKELTLEVDHIDGNYLNNLKDNLRFICPNCHSQTKNYKNKNRKRSESNYG
jgi:Zn finger protein HypA/HybF involved in hydrogenase expression